MPRGGQGDTNPHLLGISKAAASRLICVCSVHQEIFYTCTQSDIYRIYLFPSTVLTTKHTSSNLVLPYSSIPGTSDDDTPPFQHATPPRFQVDHIPKGNLVVHPYTVAQLSTA